MNINPTELRLAIKGVTIFHTNDGYAYDCSVYFDGKRVGKAQNSGNGGPTDFDFVSREIQQQVEAYAKSLPRSEPHRLFPEGLERDLEFVVDELIGWNDMLKQFKKSAKKSIIFVVKDKNEPDFPLPESFKLVPKSTKITDDALKQLIIADFSKKSPDKKVIFLDQFF